MINNLFYKYLNYHPQIRLFTIDCFKIVISLTAITVLYQSSDYRVNDERDATKNITIEMNKLTLEVNRLKEQIAIQELINKKDMAYYDSLPFAIKCFIKSPEPIIKITVAPTIDQPQFK